MGLTHSITDAKQLGLMADYLYNKKIDKKKKNKSLTIRDKRDYIMFEVGINLGIRISDFTKQKVSFYRRACELGYVEFVPAKTKRFNKKVKIFIAPELQELIEEYIEDMSDDDWMFKSSKGGPLTRQQVFRIMQEAARYAGIEEEIGCHGLRKTFGYWHYYYNKDIRLLMDIFGHSEEAITLRYIGVTDEAKKESMKYMTLGVKALKEQ